MKLRHYLIWLLWRDLSLAWRNRAGVGVGLIFFILVSSLFPLAINPEPNLLSAIGVAVIWVAILLANLLSLSQIFEADWRDGSLTQLLLLPLPQSLMIAVKVFAHWLTFGVPILLLSPLIALQYQLPESAYVPLLLGLLLGTPILSALGALTSALTLGLDRSGALLALLQLPLCVPILIFGCQAVLLVLGGGSAMPALWLLLVLLLGTWFFMPYVCLLAIKQLF
ncbi:MAG: heme exporter protein CcmB [Neisseriaceae bacterium]|nr:heme exporter protein CcmB [Neisseriaceae bacterium]